MSAAHTFFGNARPVELVPDGVPSPRSPWACSRQPQDDGLGSSSPHRTNIWRWTLIALSTLILCSCRGTGAISPQHPAVPPPQADCWQGPPPMDLLPAVPLASETLLAAADEANARVKFNDEYICDGGDAGLPVRVTPDWHLNGLDREDTIAHYEGLDGQTFVQPSNRVCVYAPRFASVRMVRNVIEDDQVHAPAGVALPVQAQQNAELRIPVASTQPIRAQTDVGRRQAGAYATRWGDGVISTAKIVRGVDTLFSPFEDLGIIRRGVFEQAEEARLATAVQSAKVWLDVQKAQVIIDHQQAIELATVQTASATYTVDEPRGPAKLRLVKVASKQEALPGETVDFTLRFDNVGGQVIGNIVIVDHLHQRLEFVPESAQCSVEATFTTEEDEFGSLVLRWEITEPLALGEGGIARFQCRMR